MSTIDLAFSLTANDTIPADHAYLLHAAVTSALPALHGAEGYGLHPITGRQIGGRMLKLEPWSRLTVRMAADRIPDLLPLTGSELRVGPATLRVGVPTVQPLLPATALRSRLVTIKLQPQHTENGKLTEPAFAAGVRRQLDSLNIAADAVVTVIKRRTFRLKQREIIGFEVVIENLAAADSLALQVSGVGGRRTLGCGLFTPLSVRGTT